MGSRGTIIKVGVLFVHIIVEVRVRDTDRGLKMFCVFWFHIIMIIRLNLVKRVKFQKWFFWCFFIRNNLSRVDLIIKVVLEFLSDP